MFTTLCHFFIIVFSLTFNSNPDFNEFYHKWISFLLFLIPIDILLKLNSGFFANGAPIKNRVKIIQKYYKIDLFYDLMCFLILLSKHVTPGFWAINLFQIGYFVKYPILHNLIENFEEIINFDEKVEACVSLLQLFLKLMFFSHLVACIWFTLGNSHHDKEDTWIFVKEYSEKTQTFKYLVSLYWAITTISTTGYGDITPQNEEEFLFSLIIMILGSVFFGYSLTYIGVVFDKFQKDSMIKK